MFNWLLNRKLGGAEAAALAGVFENSGQLLVGSEKDVHICNPA